MKWYTLSFLLLTGFHLFAQTNCDSVKKENEYLKKALNILTPVKSVTSSKIDFNILRCEGNTKEQTVNLILIVKNNDANKDLNLFNATAIDVEGNEYQTYKIVIGSGGSINKIYTDVPVKTVIKFEKVLPAVKLLKMIAIDIGGNDPGFEYKDIPVSWK